MDPVLRRRRWIIRRRLEGWKIKDIADALRISEKTVDRWWSVYRKERWEGLHVKSRRPHRYYKTPQSTVDLILELRRSKRWGPNKIEGYLRNYKVQGGHACQPQNDPSNPRRGWIEQSHLHAEKGLG